MLAVVQGPDRRDTVIASRHHALVARFREAARADPESPLLLDGPRLVADAMAAGLTVTEVALAASLADDPEMAFIHRHGLSVHLVTPHVLDAMSPTRTPAGMVALAERPTISADAMFQGVAPLVVIAVDVQDPGNLGAIVRAAEAGNATGVLTTTGGADPFGWKALRGSMGSALRLPIGRVPDGDAAMTLARRHGLRTAAAVATGGTTMDEADLTGPLAIVVGGEGSGLPPSIVARADLRVSIPMASPVESLNVSVASALLVYAARRQRATRADG